MPASVRSSTLPPPATVASSNRDHSRASGERHGKRWNRPGSAARGLTRRAGGLRRGEGLDALDGDADVALEVEAHHVAGEPVGVVPEAALLVHEVGED